MVDISWPCSPVVHFIDESQDLVRLEGCSCSALIRWLWPLHMLYLYADRGVAKLVDYLEHLLWLFTAFERALHPSVFGSSLLVCWLRLGFLFSISQENSIIWENFLSCLLLRTVCEFIRALIASLARWRNSFLIVISALASALLPELIADQIRPECL